MIKFSAETRSSGIDLPDSTQIRKGATDAIRNLAQKAGYGFPTDTENAVKEISGNGATPLVLAVNNEVKGVI